jgi:3-methyladenine DNA glycosylase AlkD
MEKIIEGLRQELHANVDEAVLRSSKRFFKEEVKPYGLKSSTVKQIANNYWKQLKDKPKNEIFDLCELLWQSGYLEESFIACHWSYAINKKYEEADIETFERWINKYVSNWASCDTLCNHNVGDLLVMYPAHIERLKRWSKSDNRWVKRAAAVSLIIPARKGLFLNEIFQIADILLTDADDLVQKGYGWMLKAASESDQKRVFDYVMANKATMPRTALRYAIEKMPADLKTKAMEK